MTDTFPEIPIEKFDYSNSNWNYSSESMSKKIQTISRNVQRFEFTLKLPKLTKSEYLTLSAFLAKQNGRFGIFELSLPDIHDKDNGYGNTSGTASGTPLCMGSDPASKKVVLKSMIGKLSEGDFIAFGNHTKLYQVTVANYINETGDKEIQVNPSLRTSVPEDTPIIINDVKARVSLDSDDFSFSVDPDGMYSIKSIKLVERY